MPLLRYHQSQRDLGLQVPVNYVTVPGVSFSAACFPVLRYEDDNSGDCLSNLLAVGIRRLEIDLYWDQGRQIWSFCPVAIPTSIPNAMPSSTATLSFPPSNLSALIAAAEPTSSSISSQSPRASSSSSSQSKLSTQQVTSDVSIILM
jgi:hypothetical protein